MTWFFLVGGKHSRLCFADEQHDLKIVPISTFNVIIMTLPRNDDVEDFIENDDLTHPLIPG